MFMEDTRKEEGIVPTFKLSDLARMYKARLEQLGVSVALVQANIASTGTADSFVKASHVTKTRHAHQATAASLYMLCCTKHTPSTHQKLLK